MALTPEEQLELEEIRRQREALEADQLSINEEIAKLEQSQPTAPIAPQPTAPIAASSPKESEGFFSRIGTGVKNIVEPIAETGFELASAAEKGFEQALTSEFADEARAKAIAAATGRPEEEVLAEVRAEFEKSAKESPISTALGGLAGGIAQGAAISAATGGFGAPAAAANVASKVSFISRLLRNAAKGVAIGSAMGAAAGAGASKKTLKEQKKEGFKEAVEASKRGALFGGGLSAAGTTGGAALSKIGEKASKAIDEGKLPAVARLVRQAWRSGKEGKGFSGEAAKDRYTDEAFDVAENVVRPKITSTLTELRELRDNIVEQAEGTVDISVPIQNLTKQLKALGFQDAEILRQGIKKSYNSIADKGYITLADANRMAKNIADEIQSKPELRGKIKEISYAAVNDIKNLVKDRIPTAEAVKIVSQDPKLLNSYRKYVSNIADDELAEMLTAQNRMKPAEALKKAKEIKDVFKTMGEAFKDEDPEAVSSIILDPAIKDTMTQILRVTNPIKVLDSKMKKILDASEIMGEITLGKGEAEIVDDVVKIFKNIITQPKDSQAAYIAKKRYEKSMSSLKEAVPELANEIEERVKPVLADLELQRYIEGAGFDQSVKESGILKKLAGDVFRTGTQATNIAAQTIAAARKGEAGPIVGLPTTTLMKPGVSTLASLKTKVDNKLVSNPNNKVYKTFSEMIDSAIENQDEGRQIAVLNTLMQYEPIRKMMSEEE